MKAIFLVRKGAPSRAFEMKEVPVPRIQKGEILIKVEGFGLNFADVLARNGLYPDAPKMPCILGYDVVGTVTEVAPDVTRIKPGERVTAMTHFGGYAEYAAAPAFLVAPITNQTPMGEATALTVQYCTAYFAACEMVNLYKGDRVLIHAAAGGVGTALMQITKSKGCEIFATAGSESKLELLRKSGADHVIDYNDGDFSKAVLQQTGGQGLDVIFDSIGGLTTTRGFRLLSPGGRLICYGAAAISGRGLVGKIRFVFGSRFYHPLQLMSTSKTLIGVNMLKIAEKKPEIFDRCLPGVLRLYNEGMFKPLVEKVFPVSEFNEAHELLESRKSTGKITISW